MQKKLQKKKKTKKSVRDMIFDNLIKMEYYNITKKLAF